MAIRIITGRPRSGKTYYAVYHVSTTYFTREKDGSFEIKPEYANLKIVSNIENLQIPHEPLQTWIDGAGGVDKLFSLEYQKKIQNKYPQIVYLIDEAQFFFPATYKNNAFFNWLEYHGHLGQDIFFMTHAFTSMPRHVFNLAELTLGALPRTTSFLGGRDLRYNVYESGIIVDKKVLLKKKWVFDLYKSQSAKEVEKTGNPFLKYLVIFIIVLLFGFYNGYARVMNLGDQGDQGDQDKKKSVFSSTVKSALSDSIKPQAEKVIPSIWVTVSHVVQGESILVVYRGSFVSPADTGYEFRLAPMRQVQALVPADRITDFVPADDSRDADYPSSDIDTGERRKLYYNPDPDCPTCEA
jgi:hypothetical protein